MLQEALIPALDALTGEQFEWAMSLVHARYPGLPSGPGEEMQFDITCLDSLALRQLMDFTQTCAKAAQVTLLGSHNSSINNTATRRPAACIAVMYVYVPKTDVLRRQSMVAESAFAAQACLLCCSTYVAALHCALGACAVVWHMCVKHLQPVSRLCAM